MILRDAIFSAERRHLGAQSVTHAHSHAHASTPADVTPLSVAEPATIYASEPPAPPALSSDGVASWLVTQDGATRTALAALLADELADVREAARLEGYEHGHEEAMREARDKVGSALAALAELHGATEHAFDSEVARLDDACADIVAEVFFKLAGGALVSREAIVGVVAEVLKRVREEREMRIHVNPADLAVLRTAEAGIAASLPGRTFTLVADARVETGGCMVESTLGSLDGRLEVQLAELCAVLRAAKREGA